MSTTEPQSYTALSTNFHDQLDADLERGVLAPPTTYRVGLLTNATDDLQQDSDYADIATEPGGGNYAIQEMAAQNLTTARVDGVLRTMGPEIEFNVVGATQDVDSWFVLTTFDYLTSDAAPVEHLIAFGPLSPGGDRTQSDSGRYTVPLERPDRYVLTDVNWTHDSSTEAVV